MTRASASVKLGEEWRGINPSVPVVSLNNLRVDPNDSSTQAGVQLNN
jgi:hypothetical protein